MRAAVSVLALVLLVTGCSEGVPGTAVEAKLFDPCTDLSNEALWQANLLPDSKSDLVQFDGWHICSWDDSTDWYRNTAIYSTELRLVDFRANKTKTEFRDIEVNGRQALEYKEVNTRELACTVGFETARGSVHVEVGWLSNAPANRCQLAAEHASRLLPYLPD